MQAIPSLFLLFLGAILVRSSSAASIQLPELQLQSMVFLGNASFGRAGQIELNNQITIAPSSSSARTLSNGRALYNTPLQLLNPTPSFATSFTFATLPESNFAFLIAPNNQDLSTLYGLWILFATPNNTVTIFSGQRPLASTAAPFNLSEDSRRTFVWVSYDSKSLRLDLKASNLSAIPPATLLALRLDPLTVFNQFMFVGFSASASLTSTRSTVFAWNFTTWSTLPSSSSSSPSSTPVNSSRKARNIAAAGIAAAALGVAIAAAALIIRHMKSKSNLSSSAAKIITSFARTTTSTTTTTTADLSKDHSAWLRRFTFKELAAATDNFDAKHRLGQQHTRINSQCFRGVLSDCMVAVKIVSRDDPSIIHENWKLISELATLRHRNLVNLTGYSTSANNSSMLIYEFIPNGSLDEHLYNNVRGGAPLAWSHRHKAALGLAQAIDHLHSRGIVHGNIKSSNVLLDGNFTPRLGDYSLKNRLLRSGGGKKPVAGTRIVAGTFGYVAPEAVQTGIPSLFADVFAFGAVLLELVCGRRPVEGGGGDGGDEDGDEEEGAVMVLVDRVREAVRRNMFETVVDSKLGKLYDVWEMEAMVTVGLACSEYDPERRPTMDKVVKMLAAEIALPRLESLINAKLQESPDDLKSNKQQQQSDDARQKSIEEMLVMKDFGSLFK